MEKYHGLIWLVVAGIYAYNFPRFSLGILVVVLVVTLLPEPTQKR